MSQFDELPKGWKVCTLEEISKLATGKTPSTSKIEFWDGDIPFVTPSQVHPSGYIISPQRSVTNEGAKQARIIPSESILIVCIGSVGKIGYLDRDAVINQQLNALIPESYILSKYLYYWSKHYLQNWVIQNAVATVNAAILNKSRLGQAPAIVAPLNEQQRIVEKIEALTVRSRKARAALDEIPALLDQFRQSVLAAAFRGDLTADWRAQNLDVEPAEALLERIKKIRLSKALTTKAREKILEVYQAESIEDSSRLPEFWEYCSLEKLCDSFQYGTSAKSLSEGDVPVLRMGNLQKGEIDWSGLAYSSDLQEIEKYKLNPGDVLFNRTNSPELVGKTSIYRGDRPAIFAGYLIKIRNHPELNSEYLNFFLNTNYAKAFCWKVKSDGVSQSNINAQKLGKFEIPLCSEDEQKEIVHQVKSLLNLANSIEQQYKEAIPDTDQLDQSILAKAFRGELVPQDPNDEPAAVLLDRIRAERERLGNGKKRAKAKV